MTTHTAFEAEITPGMAVGEVVDLARSVEQAGFDRLGISDVVAWHDSYVLQGACLAATDDIEIGAMVTNPYTRHPVVHAGALSTLADLSGGRVFCGMGTGAGIEDLEMEMTRPARTVREAVEIIRRLCAGERLTYRGEIFDVVDLALTPAPTHPVPIAIGTRSPRVMALAGELADVALVGARSFTPETVARYRSWLTEGTERAGRTLADVQVAPRVTLCISEDADVARASVARYAAHYLDISGGEGLGLDEDRITAIRAALGRSTGWYFDHDRHDDAELTELIDDDLAEAFAIVGTPERCAEMLTEIVGLGFGAVSCNLAAVRRPGENTMAEGLSETIDGAARMLSLVAPGQETHT